MFDRLYESFHFIFLLLGDVSEAYQINCDIVLFKFLSQNLQGLNVFGNGWADETNHSLFLGLIGSVFKSEGSDLQGLGEVEFAMDFAAEEEGAGFHGVWSHGAEDFDLSSAHESESYWRLHVGL